MKDYPTAEVIESAMEKLQYYKRKASTSITHETPETIIKHGAVGTTSQSECPLCAADVPKTPVFPKINLPKIKSIDHMTVEERKEFARGWFEFSNSIKGVAPMSKEELEAARAERRKNNPLAITVGLEYVGMQAMSPPSPEFIHEMRYNRAMKGI